MEKEEKGRKKGEEKKKSNEDYSRTLNRYSIILKIVITFLSCCNDIVLKTS